MSKEELKKTLEAMERVRQDMAGSKEKTLAFLVEAGILLPDGSTPAVGEEHQF